MTDQYADWDGAYVMGSLSRAERVEYEEHLATCPDCARAVAELAPLPGLLGRLERPDAELLLTPVAEPPASIATPRVVPLERPSLWRRTSVRLSLGAAAAAVVAAAVVIPLAVHDAPGADATVALHSVVGRTLPLSATVGLTSTTWGTEVDMTCVYAGYEGASRPYMLYVVDTAGRTELVSSWHAAPGETARTVGSTDLAVGDIAQVQLRAPDGTVLLAARTPSA